MIMTLQKFGGAGLSSTVSALILSTGILILVAMMVLPLPTFLLDTFFVSNILLSILVSTGLFKLSQSATNRNSA
jgi:flagellar biosynthesis protein FlhA